MQHHLVIPLLVAFLALADFNSLLAVSNLTPPLSIPSLIPDDDLEIELRHPHDYLELGTGGPQMDPGVEILHSGQMDSESLPDPVMSTWNEQVLEFDELTKCIRNSETGNAIERWLDCLESFEEVSATESPTHEPLESQHSGTSTDKSSSHVKVEGSLQFSEDLNIGTFDPLGGASMKGSHAGSFEKNSGSVETSETVGDIFTATSVDDPFSDEKRIFGGAPVSEVHESSATAASDLSSHYGVKTDEVDHLRPPPSHSEMSEETEKSQALHGNCVGAGTSADGGAADARSSGSKGEADTNGVSDDSENLQCNVPKEDVDHIEVPTETATFTGRTKRLQNVMDALKLAACLGVAVALIWRKKRRESDYEKAQQSLLSERIEEYPCPSASGFSMTGRASSNTDMAYPNVKAGSLSAPLGMAIATVMAEVLEQDPVNRTPRTADKLSRLLEAAMTESLLPVMGSGCPGFVEQFKQSFNSTYRLLRTVRNASSRSHARPSLNQSWSLPLWLTDAPSRGLFRRTDDEEDDSSSLTSFSREAYMDPIFGSDSFGRGSADSATQLTEQFSKLSVSSKKPEKVAKIMHTGRVSPGYPSKNRPFLCEYSSPLNQDISGEFGDVSSSLRYTSAGLSEHDTVERKQNYGGSEVHENGARSKWGRGGLEQLANIWGIEDVASQSASQQNSRDHEGSACIDQRLAMQPFGDPLPGQLAGASETGLSHLGATQYQQEKVLLRRQEMHLRKMELTYKFRDLHLKEANLHLASETNSLMREDVGLSRNKIDLKETEFQYRKLSTAYADFSRRCADEMVAGLCVMLCALFFGAWRYSYDHLINVVSVCQPIVYEPSNSYVPGLSMIVNLLNLMTSQLLMLVCEVTVAARMFLGLGVISVVAVSLLRKSVSSSSQAMPATILIVVLGGICGVAGKFAVDSLGGSGYHWLLVWETFCLVHTSAACFTSTLYRFLNGAPLSATSRSHQQPYYVKPWLRRLCFHVVIVLVLPTLAGLFPFARVRDIVLVLGSNLWNLVYSPVESQIRKCCHFLFL